jgi:hypothetical protein
MLTVAETIDGNEYFSCSGTTTGIDNCEIMYNSILKHGQGERNAGKGCYVCKEGFVPVRNESTGVFSCQSGTLAHCKVFDKKYSESNSIRCEACDSGYYQANSGDNCVAFSGSNYQQITHCLSHKLNRQNKIECLACASGYG